MEEAFVDWSLWTSFLGENENVTILAASLKFPDRIPSPFRANIVSNSNLLKLSFELIKYAHQNNENHSHIFLLCGIL